MKKHAIAVAALALGLATGSGAYAQGRHDEKPHGMQKQTDAAKNSSERQATGGRHDEGATSHGKKKSTKASKRPVDPASK